MIPAEVINTSKGAVDPLQGMKAYWESRDITPLILNISTRWKWVVNVTPQLLYHQKRNLKPTVKEDG